MRISMPFSIAIEALNINKARSLLTTLGIVIGVSAVITMSAIGEGAKAKMQTFFDALGTNMLVVTSGSSHMGGIEGGVGSLPTLTWGDLQAIRNEVPSVRRASPLMMAALQLTSVDTNWSTSVQGVDLDYFEIRNWPVRQGALFTKEDAENGNKVVVLGQTVVTRLFGASAHVVGETIRIRNAPFRVVGVLSVKGQMGMGQDQDDSAYVPIKAFLTKLRGTSLGDRIPGAILLQATSTAATSAVERQVTQLLRDRHRIDRPEDDDFAVENFQQMVTSFQDSLSTVSILLSAVAAVSLLVGGIGIMNIMLVSVTERTKEIGLRMAIGAKPYDILEQFLVEAITLSLVGGLIGICFGIGAAYGLATQFGWNLVIQPQIILLSTSFSAGVGIGFGFYPALKASRMVPMEAMRQE